MRAVWLSPSPAGLPSTFPAGVPEVSRFSCTKLPGVSGVYDYAGLTADSRLRLRSCCLPLNPQRRRPDCNFSKLDTQPTCTSVYASPGTSRHLTQNSRPSGSLPLSRKTLPFSASCRFIPAHGFPFWLRLHRAGTALLTALLAERGRPASLAVRLLEEQQIGLGGTGTANNLHSRYRCATIATFRCKMGRFEGHGSCETGHPVDIRAPLSRVASPSLSCGGGRPAHARTRAFPILTRLSASTPRPTQRLMPASPR